MEKKFQKRGHAERFLSSEEKKRNDERRRRIKNIKRALSRKVKESARVPLTFDGFSSTLSSSSFIFIYV